MKIIPVEESVGKPLAHDVTQIIPGKFKGARYKKGYMVKAEDIPVLLSMGKENLYVMDVKQDAVHEDEAAYRIAAAAAGENVILNVKGEGKVELKAGCKGLLKIKEEVLAQLLDHDEIMFASIHQNQMVEENQILAGTRVIPLYVEEELVKKGESCLDIISVIALKDRKVGVITTGSEIYHERIKDAFGDILREKFSQLGSHVVKQVFADDDSDMIAACISELAAEGMDFISVTGGMSVDPDDLTPAGIRASGAKIISYGAPILPGAMFLMAYMGEIPIVGLPGCVMYHGISVFDLIVPRLLAGERIQKKDIKALAQGGLCRNCKVCTYPNCGFGK